MTKQIIEIHSLTEVAQHLSDETHLFLDLDNTLFTSRSEFGSERWERFMIDHFIREGVTEKEAIERASHLWKAVQTVSEIEFVEEQTHEIVQKLRQKGRPLFAITARDFLFRSVTEAQLSQLGLHFSECRAPQGPYSKGVFYCGHIPKGQILNLYAKKHHPPHIVLVDDYRSHLEAALDVLEAPFTGLRYGFLDGRKSSYIPCEITKLFGKIFTHPKASHFLRNGTHKEKTES